MSMTDTLPETVTAGAPEGAPVAAAPLATPAFWQEVREVFRDGSAHIFALHGAVNDYVYRSQSLQDWFELAFGARTFVVFYSRSSGFTFGAQPGAETRKEAFVALAGLGTPPGTPALPGQAGGPPALQLDRFGPPSVALPILDRLLRSAPANSCAIVVDFAETVLPDGDMSGMNAEDRTALVTVLSWAKDLAGDLATNPVFLLTRHLPDLHREITAASSGVYAIEVPNPDENGRSRHIEYLRDTIAAALAKQAEREGRPVPEDRDILAIEVPTFARASAGLLRRHLDDIAWRAKQAGEKVTLASVRKRKAKIIESEFASVLEVWEPEFGFESVGGQEHLKAFFRKSVIEPMRDGNRQRVPMGILMMGPSGTGKSHFARAVAKEAGITCVKLTPAKLYDKYQGGSERNWKRAENAITDMAPCLVFQDEVDQQGGSRAEQGDGGVGGRVFGMMIEWMADPSHRGKIIQLAATNRPDLLDAAFRAPHRFSKKVPFLPPDSAERALILGVIHQRVFGMDPAPLGSWFVTLAAECEGWTGSELEALATKAYEVYLDTNLGPWEDVLVTCYEQAKRSYRATTADVQFWSLLALRECNDLSLLPPHFAQYLEQPEKIESDIQAHQARQSTGRTERIL